MRKKPAMFQKLTKNSYQSRFFDSVKYRTPWISVAQKGDSSSRLVCFKLNERRNRKDKNEEDTELLDTWNERKNQ